MRPEEKNGQFDLHSTVHEATGVVTIFLLIPLGFMLNTLSYL